MIIPFIALIAVIIFVVMFLAKAKEKKAEGSDMGEHGVQR